LIVTRGLGSSWMLTRGYGAPVNPNIVNVDLENALYLSSPLAMTLEDISTVTTEFKLEDKSTLNMIMEVSSKIRN
jgi:hypothetical protein